MSYKLFTSESVTEGHPDKVCDAISDAILDAALRIDPNARVAIETLVKTGNVVIAGEMTYSGEYLDVVRIARDTLKEIGYDDPRWGFPSEEVAVLNLITKQSPDISQGIDTDKGTFSGQGAGDQGLMFGFANKDTDQLMPIAIHLSHVLALKLANERKRHGLNIGPDGKSQVTVRYYDDGSWKLDTVVISTHHPEEYEIEALRKDLKERVIDPVIKDLPQIEDLTILINPTGKFVVGGPVADAGLTGRKIIVDTYGGYGRHGGGAFSGKDPSKVDRSAAYAARWVAKNVVASGVCTECEVQLAYAIGYPKPVSVRVDTFGTLSSEITEDQLGELINEVFDLSPAGINEALGLRAPQYLITSSYGHFGYEEYSWEKLNMVDAIRAAIG